jgi:hypothetical protein
VQKAYAPTVEKAKLADSERRRADEMKRTVQTLDRAKQALTERLNALEGHLAPVIELASLSKQEYTQLVRHAKERVEAIKAERELVAEKTRIDHERRRRVDDLVRVEGSAAGAAKTFAQHGLKAIENAGGDVSKVQWPDVEKAAIYESIMQRRHDPKSVLSALVKHSPGMVDQVRQAKAQEFISIWSGKEIAASKVSKERDGPSR